MQLPYRRCWHRATDAPSGSRALVILRVGFTAARLTVAIVRDSVVSVSVQLSMFVPMGEMAVELADIKVSATRTGKRSGETPIRVDDEGVDDQGVRSRGPIKDSDPLIGPLDRRCDHASTQSVCGKSSPTHNNGSPATTDIAYDRQSPKLRAARWRPRP